MIFRQSYAFYLVVARKSLVIFHFSLIKFGLFISKSYLCTEKGVLGASLKFLILQKIKIVWKINLNFYCMHNIIEVLIVLIVMDIVQVMVIKL